MVRGVIPTAHQLLDHKKGHTHDYRLKALVRFLHDINISFHTATCPHSTNLWDDPEFDDVRQNLMTRWQDYGADMSESNEVRQGSFVPLPFFIITVLNHRAFGFTRFGKMMAH